MTLADDELSFTYKAVPYVFLKKVDRTVHFETNGGSAISDATVVNGKNAARPQEPSLVNRSSVGIRTVR